MASIRIGGLRWDLIANVGTFNRNMQQANRIMMQQATVSGRASAATARNTQVTNAAAAAHARAAQAAASHAAAIGALQTMSIGGAFGGKGGRLVGAGLIGARFGAIGGAGIVGLGTAMLAKSSFDTARNFEEMRFDMQTLVGDIDRGNELFQTMFRLSQQTALTMEGAANAARQLLAFGVPADEIERLSDAMADISGGNSLRMQRLSLAIGQIFSAGRLFGTERRQLTELGFNPLQQISERTGESMEDLNKRMEEGKIGWNEVRQAIEDATSAGGRFFQRSERRMETMNGKLDVLTGKWQKLLDTIGQRALPVGSAAADVAGAVVDEASDSASGSLGLGSFTAVGALASATRLYNRGINAGANAMSRFVMPGSGISRTQELERRMFGLQLGLAMGDPTLLKGVPKQVLEARDNALKAFTQSTTARGLIEAFDPNNRPGINLNAAFVPFENRPGFVGPLNRTGAARRGALAEQEVVDQLKQQLEVLENQRDEIQEQNKRLGTGSAASNIGGSFGSREEFAARQAMQQQQRQAEAAEEAFRRAEEQREREITILEAIDRKMEQIQQAEPVEAI